jgi:Immunity protein Imm1
MGIRPSRMEISGVRPENERTVEGPTWQQVEEAIRTLDEDSSSDVILAVEDGWYLAVAGGNGRYLVFAQEPSGEDVAVAELVAHEARTGPPVQLVVGGVYQDFPPAALTDLETALQAARAYLETGDLDPQLHWRWQR